MPQFHKLAREADKQGHLAERSANANGLERYYFLIAHHRDHPFVRWALENNYAHLNLGQIELHFHADSSDEAKQRAYIKASWHFLMKNVSDLSLRCEARS